jgi:hypothetical protein
MTVGQDLSVKNSDGFLHNVHSLAVENPAFNFGQPNKNPGQKVPEQPKITETFRVKCDVHPWMSAYIGVFEHPFHAVSDEDGKYTIKGTLPDGEYTLVAWHEKFGEKEEQITIKDGKAEKNFAFKSEAAQATPVDANVKLASLEEKKGDAACPTGACCPGDKPAKPAAGTVARQAPVAPTASAR